LIRFIIIIIFFIVGYCFIRSIIKKLIRYNGHQSKDDAYWNKDEKRQEYHSWKRVNQEEKYRQILGVTDTDSPANIKEKYRDLIAKYHPDKLQHLGEEFQEIAEQKTKAIIEAYEFFRKRYNV